MLQLRSHEANRNRGTLVSTFKPYARLDFLSCIPQGSCRKNCRANSVKIFTKPVLFYLPIQIAICLLLNSMRVSVLLQSCNSCSNFATASENRARSPNENNVSSEPIELASGAKIYERVFTISLAAIFRNRLAQGSTRRLIRDPTTTWKSTSVPP